MSSYKKKYMPSVKKNFGYNLILTLCGYIFPLITYPYVSRVLGVQNIGICNFVDSIINYFIIFSMLGISSFGVREIARFRENIERRNDAFTNLITINVITTVFAVVVLIVCTYTVPKLSEYKPFLLVGITKIVFNVFLIEWFFQGIQNFKYITIRTLLVRVLYVILVFIFVQDREDTLIFFSLTIFITVINSIINWAYSHKFVTLQYRIISIQHLRLFILPILSFGYYKILTSMYTTFNTVFLGLATNNLEVGYFTTATKLYSIIMGVLTAFTTVMIPRVAVLLHEGKKKDLQRIMNQTLSIVTAVSIPIILYCLFWAEDIIFLIAGSGYEGSVTPFRIVILLLLFIGFEQIIIQQFLMASTKNKPILIISTIGAIIGIVFNIILTPLFGAIGSAISWGVSEICVLFSGIYFVRKSFGVFFPFNSILKDFLWDLFYVTPLIVIYCMKLNMWYHLIVSGVVIFVLFIIINCWIHKNDRILEMLEMVRNVIGKKY